MKKLNTYIFGFAFFCIFSILLFNTCKKYDQGSWIKNSKKNLFGQKKDLSAKEWSLTLYEVNGIDSTGLIAGASTIPDFYSHFVTFKIIRRKEINFIALTFLYENSGEIHEENKTLQFLPASSSNSGYLNDSLQCSTKYNTFYCQRNIFTPEKNKRTNWNIKKLTATELTITASLVNSYKIILKSN